MGVIENAPLMAADSSGCAFWKYRIPPTTAEEICDLSERRFQSGTDNSQSRRATNCLYTYLILPEELVPGGSSHRPTNLNIGPIISVTFPMELCFLTLKYNYPERGSAGVF